MPGISLRSFCKVNLCLEVLGRREDGYHELATVFQTVSLADTLTVVPTAGPDLLRVPRGGAPAGPDNLCLRAVRAYRNQRGWPPGVRLQLDKTVPAGAGLGGGSSNAAATLRALALLDDQPPSDQALHQIAATLGADVAFFLTGGTALGTGRGEKIERLPDLAGLPLVLARPRLSISTAEAYGMLSPEDFSDGARARAMAQAICEGAGIEGIAAHLHNAFTASLVRRWPEVAEVLEALRDAGAVRAEVSGSGSACFGLFPDADAAEAAALRLQVLGLWAVEVQSVNRGWEVVDEAADEAYG